MARSDQRNPVMPLRHALAKLFHERSRLRIGILGGSFNPAHGGHLHISGVARRALRLDQVWWLVSPQNPLKPEQGMAPLANRLATGRSVAEKHPFIRVIAPEAQFRTTRTYHSLATLRARCPRHAFCWLMGADNMVSFARWQRHDVITRTMPIAVIDRPGYSYQAIGAGRRLLGRRVSTPKFRALAFRADTRPPLWSFIAGRRHHASATALRETGTAPE